jgi:hypothetical protein
MWSQRTGWVSMPESFAHVEPSASACEPYRAAHQGVREFQHAVALENDSQRLLALGGFCRFLQDRETQVSSRLLMNAPVAKKARERI